MACVAIGEVHLLDSTTSPSDGEILAIFDMAVNSTSELAVVLRDKGYLQWLENPVVELKERGVEPERLLRSVPASRTSGITIDSDRLEEIRQSDPKAVAALQRLLPLIASTPYKPPAAKSSVASGIVSQNLGVVPSRAVTDKSQEVCSEQGSQEPG